MLWFTVTVILSFKLDAQCPVEVEALGDTTFCSGGGTAFLEGNIISGDPFDYNWSPASLVDDPNALNTTATVNGPAEIVFTAFCQENNIIVNGDFEQGNTGFSSDYTYSATDLVPEGVYTVTNNPNLVHPAFAACSDHTSGSGQMMVVNGETTAGANVWCETINVTPNTQYVFQTWITTVVASNPAQLQFTINGITLGNIFQAPPVNCVWIQFYEFWNSMGSTTAEICITNQNTIAAGNDFALDDIFFGAIMEASDTVYIDIAENVVSTMDTTVCEGESVSIGSQSFSDPGTYQVPLQGQAANGCDSIVELNLDNVQLDIQIQADPFLNCENPLAEIDASLSSSGPHIFYQWDTPDGNIVSGQGTPVIQIDMEGTYTLTLIYDDGDQFCSITGNGIFIQDIGGSPEVEVVSIPFLNCEDSTGNIIASSPVLNYAASWTSNDGQVIEGENSLSPQINGPGTYDLYFIDTDSGCDTFLSVEVDGNFNRPEALPDPYGSLSCDVDSVLVTTSSIGAGETAEWLDDNGMVIGTGPEVWIVMEGNYRLRVTDPQSQCESVTEFTVVRESGLPELPLPDSLYANCYDSTAFISEDIIDDFSDLSLRWVGSILPQDADSGWIFHLEGMYTLLVTDTFSGCVDSLHTYLNTNRTLPAFEPLPDSSISCARRELLYFVTTNGSDTDFSFDWKESNDNSYTEGDSFIVSREGLYLVNVTNVANGCSKSDTFQIGSAMDLPVYSVSGRFVLNCTRQSSVLTGIVAGADDQISWSWSTVDGEIEGEPDSSRIRALVAGTYRFTVTDEENGCSLTDSVELISDTSVPVVDAGADMQLSCTEPELSLSGTYSGTDSVLVEWYSPDGLIQGAADTADITASGAGIYIFTVTDLRNGCSASDSLSVVSDEELPVITTIPDSSLNCGRDRIELWATVENAGTDAVLHWTTPDGLILNGDSTASPLVGAAGLYRLSVYKRENGCSANASVRITMDTLPPQASVGEVDPLTCIKDSTLLQIETDAVPLTYQWETTDGNIQGATDNSSVIAVESGLYFYTVTDERNHCASSGSVFLAADTSKPDAVPAEVLPLNCNRTVSWLGFGSFSPETGLSFEWTTPAGAMVNADSSFIMANTAGIYLALVRNEVNGCTAAYTFDLPVDSLRPEAMISGTDSLNCRGTGYLSAAGSSSGSSFSYEWSSPQGYPIDQSDPDTPLIIRAGTYVLQVTDQTNGCSASDSLIVGPASPLDVALAVTEARCDYPLAKIRIESARRGLPPFSIAVDDSSLFQPASPAPELAPGTHTVYVKDARNCLYTENITVADTMGIGVDLPAEIILEPGQQIILDPQLSFPVGALSSAMWTGSGQLSCTDCLQPQLIATEETELRLMVTDSNGCVAYDRTRIALEIDPRIYIPNAFSPNGDGVNEHFRPYTDPSVVELLSFEIYNRWGDRVHYRQALGMQDPSLGWDGYFKGKKMQPAVYVYHMSLRDILGGIHFRKGEVVLME